MAKKAPAPSHARIIPRPGSRQSAAATSEEASDEKRRKVNEAIRKASNKHKSEKQLADSMGQILASASRLNLLTDQAAETIKQVEHFLNEECSLGVPAAALVTQSESDTDEDVYLSYGRYGDRFRILIVRGCEHFPEDATVKPWSQWPRGERLRAFEKLPELLAQIAKNTEQQIERSTATIVDVSKALTSFSAKEGE